MPIDQQGISNLQNKLLYCLRLHCNYYEWIVEHLICTEMKYFKTAWGLLNLFYHAPVLSSGHVLCRVLAHREVVLSKVQVHID